MNWPQPKDVCHMGTVHRQTILCSAASPFANARTIPLPWNHEFWQLSVPDPLLCKMLINSGQPKTLSQVDSILFSFPFLWPLVFSAFFFLIYIFLILDFCLCEVTLWPELKNGPLAPVSNRSVCIRENSWSARSPTLGAEKSRRDNPWHGRQITAISMSNEPPSFYQNATISGTRKQ